MAHTLEHLNKQIAVCNYLVDHDLGLSAVEIFAVRTARGEAVLSEEQMRLLEPHVDALVNKGIKDPKELCDLANEVFRHQLKDGHEQDLKAGQTGWFGRIAIGLSAALPLATLPPAVLYSLGIAISNPLHLALMAVFFVFGMALKLNGANNENANFTQRYKLLAIKKQLLSEYNKTALAKNQQAIKDYVSSTNKLVDTTIAKAPNESIRECFEHMHAEKHQALSKPLIDILAELPEDYGAESSKSVALPERKFWQSPKLWIKRLMIGSLALSATVFGGYIALFKIGVVAGALSALAGPAMPFILIGIGVALTAALLGTLIYGDYKKHSRQQHLNHLERAIRQEKVIKKQHEQVEGKLSKLEPVKLEQGLDTTLASLDEPAAKHKTEDEEHLHTKAPSSPQEIQKSSTEKDGESEGENEGEGEGEGEGNGEGNHTEFVIRKT